MKKLIASLLILVAAGPACAQSAMEMKTPPDAPVITSGTKLFEPECDLWDEIEAGVP